MRKRNIHSFFDYLFWFIVSVAPLFAWVLLSFVLKDNESAIIDNFLLFSDSDLIYKMFSEIFGADGLLPLFNSNSFIFKYLVYFCWVELLHVFVDVCVFFPRLIHNLMDSFSKEKHNE